MAIIAYITLNDVNDENQKLIKYTLRARNAERLKRIATAEKIRVKNSRRSESQ